MAVPEPGPLSWVALAGLGGLAMLRRRKRSASAA
ncbi:MAG: MYXO-CTERM sorting domain-containing protein [Planctomycetaceae bacterium]